MQVRTEGILDLMSPAYAVRAQAYRGYRTQQGVQVSGQIVDNWGVNEWTVVSVPARPETAVGWASAKRSAGYAQPYLRRAHVKANKNSQDPAQD